MTSAKNKLVAFFGSMMLMTGAVKAQNGIDMSLTPKPKADTAKTVAAAPAVTAKTAKEPKVRAERIKKDRSDRPDNGFTTFNVGATYSMKNSLWNAGAQFNWHGNAAFGKEGSFAHRWLQVRGGFTLRNKKQQSGYSFAYGGVSGAGGYYYKPTEVDAHILIGPKFAIPTSDNEVNRGIIMPYGGIGGSYGWGSYNNDVTYLSPEGVYGVTVLLGKIGKEYRDDGGTKLSGNTVALNLFAEGRYQILNNITLGGRIVDYYFPANNGPNMRNTFRVGANLAFCRN